VVELKPEEVDDIHGG